MPLDGKFVVILPYLPDESVLTSKAFPDLQIELAEVFPVETDDENA